MQKQFKYALFLVVGFTLVIFSENISRRIGFKLGEHTFYLGIIIIPTILTLAILEIRKVNFNGTIDFVKALINTGIISLYASFPIGLISFVYVKYIDAERQEKILEGTRQNLIAAGKTAQEVAAQTEGLRIASSPFVMAIVSFFMTLFFCLFCSLIISAIVQRKKISNAAA
jgi:hypothetical protein